MSSPLSIVLLVVAILVVNLLVWAVTFRYLAARAREISDALVAELAASGERIALGPVRVNYRGATGKLPRVKGLSILALTDRRILVRMVKGPSIELPLSELVSHRAASAFAGKIQPGRTVEIFALASGGEFGLDVDDRVVFHRALATVAPRLATPVAS